MDFMQNLEEGRLIKNENSLKRMDAVEIADLVYVHFLVLILLRKDLEHRSYSIHYSRKTFRYGPFFTLRPSGTDLYNLLYVLLRGSENDRVLDRLKNTEESKKFLEDVEVNSLQIRRFLLYLTKDEDREEFERRFLKYLERELSITKSNYISMRRLIVKWDEQSSSTRKLVVTRLLMAIRHLGKRSDLRNKFEKYAKRKKLEIKKGVTNPEEEEGKEKSTSKMGTAAAIATGAYLGHKLSSKNRQKKKD